MTSRSRKILTAGLILLISSVPILLQMAREEISNYQYKRRYELKQLNDLYPHELKTIQRFDVRGNIIELSDTFVEGGYSQEDRRDNSVTIRINGQDYSSQSLVRIRPFYQDSNRYHLWVAVADLRDKKLDQQWFVITQRIDDNYGIWSGRPDYHSNYRFRLLFIAPEGSVREETFRYADRATPVYRTALAALVSSSPIGFHSDVYAVWPSLFYPVIFPWITGALGLILTVIGLAFRNQRK